MTNEKTTTKRINLSCQNDCIIDILCAEHNMSHSPYGSFGMNIYIALKASGMSSLSFSHIIDGD